MVIRKQFALGVSLIALGLSASVLIAGCGSKNSEERQADPEIGRSFGPEISIKQGTVGVTENHVKIQKSALGKEFLLSGNLIPQTQAATSRGLKGRVVFFEKVDYELFLFESPEGQVVTKDLPSRLILAKMPILSETDTGIVMDFNAGLNKVFTARNYHVSDAEGRGYKNEFEAAPILNSFLSQVSVQENTLEIRQNVLVPGEGHDLEHYEVRYYLAPYQTNPGFVPRETTDFKWAGFFEVSPIIQEITGFTNTRIARWDHRKPIVYSISANTPDYLVQAVKEGVLYWNKAFGADIVKVEMAPPGVSSPVASRNMIQWVPNDSAGVAYADMLADPRTGEILHAQVYMTSVFDVASRSRLPGRIRQIKAELNKAPVHQHAFEGEDLCDLPAMDTIEQQYAEFVAMGGKGLNDETLKKISQDYIRYVVAHEVGHTLGLRHNFAGSLFGNISLEQRDQLFLDYALNGKLAPETTRFSSSVMEYATFFEDVLMSSDWVNRNTVLPYDKNAIEYAYDGKVIDLKSAPLFCTDTHVGKYSDCVTFDTGPQPLASNFQTIKAQAASLAALLIEDFIYFKTARDMNLRKAYFEAPVMDVQAYAESFLVPLKAQMSWFAPKGRSSVTIDRMFSFRNAFNEKDMLRKQRDWINSQVSQLGGVAEVIAPFFATEGRTGIPLAKMGLAKLTELLKSPDTQKGIGYDGKEYTLTADEIAYIQKEGEVFFQKLEVKLIEESLKILAETVFSKELNAEAVERTVGQIAKNILLTSQESLLNGAPVVAEVGTSTVGPGFINFYYPTELRDLAVKILTPKMGEWNDFSFEAREFAKKQFTDMIKKAAGIEDLKKLDLKDGKFNRAQRQWLLKQMEYLTALEAMK